MGYHAGSQESHAGSQVSSSYTGGLTGVVVIHRLAFTASSGAWGSVSEFRVIEEFTHRIPVP